MGAATTFTTIFSPPTFLLMVDTMSRISSSAFVSYSLDSTNFLFKGFFSTALFSTFILCHIHSLWSFVLLSHKNLHEGFWRYIFLILLLFYPIILKPNYTLHHSNNMFFISLCLFIHIHHFSNLFLSIFVLRLGYTLNDFLHYIGNRNVIILISFYINFTEHQALHFEGSHPSYLQTLGR